MILTQNKTLGKKGQDAKLQNMVAQTQFPNLKPIKLVWDAQGWADEWKHSNLKFLHIYGNLHYKKNARNVFSFICQW